MSESPYITLPEAAAWMRMEAKKDAVGTLRWLIKTDRLKAVRQGRRYLTTRDWCDMYLRRSA